MDIFEWFLTPEFLALAMIVWALVWFQRKGVEIIFKRLFNKEIKNSTLWRSLFLPAGPIGTGMLFGWLVKSYPYPEALVGSDWGRIGYGLIAGIVSMQLYRLLKEWIKNKAQAASTEKKSESEPDSSE